MTRLLSALVNVVTTFCFRITSFISPICREPENEYKIFRIASAIRKKMPFLFSGVADKLATITLGEEVALDDMALDIDERLNVDAHSLYLSADKLLRSESFSHFFSERVLHKIIVACSLQENRATHPQIYVECEAPFVRAIPGVTQCEDPFARYFRKAISRRPHIVYRWFLEKKDFSRIFFRKEELLHFMAQSATVKKTFYLYLVRNAERLRGTGKEVFFRVSLEKLNSLLAQYSKADKEWKDLRAFISALEGKDNEAIAAEIHISSANDVSKRFKPAMDLAFQHGIFQLEMLIATRDRSPRKKRGLPKE